MQNNSKRKINYTDAINEALNIAMERDSRVLCYGLGVGDPKNIFGTTEGLQEKFGTNRVFDMPTSENAMTGVAIGAGLMGYRSVMVNQRIAFLLLAMETFVVMSIISLSQNMLKSLILSPFLKFTDISLTPYKRYGSSGLGRSSRRHAEYPRPSQS